MNDKVRIYTGLRDESSSLILVHREDDSDKKYGLPSLKKFPMPDAEHVRSAIKFFNYATSKEQEEELAEAIINRMKEYGLTFDDFTVGEENRFSKYIPKKELSHHGIEGQKWGVRRYQNKDGSLTALGKKKRKQLEQDLRLSYKKARHAKALSVVSDMGQKGIKKRAEIATKFDIPQHLIGLRDIVSNRVDRANNSDFANAVIKFNSTKRYDDFNKKRNDYIDMFGKTKINDLMDDSKFDLSTKQALAKTYLSAFNSIRYKPIETAFGTFTKDQYQLRDFIASKL